MYAPKLINIYIFLEVYKEWKTCWQVVEQKQAMEMSLICLAKP